MDCAFNRRIEKWKPSQEINANIRNMKLEHSNAWIKEDKKTDKFYVYILKIDEGDFYIGHTRDLRARLSEHRDSKVGSTAGKNPKLQYFEIVSNRETAQTREAELKQLGKANPREIRKIMISFHDLIRELKLE